MADNTIIQQGRFTSTGIPVRLNLRSDIDWIKVRNETATIQAAANLGTDFYWTRGMTAGRGEFWTKLGAVANDPMTKGQIAASAGFTLINDEFDAVVSATTAFTASTNATQPIVSTADTSLIIPDDVVRLSQSVVNIPSLLGIDFQIGTVAAGVSFQIKYPMATAPGVVGTAGLWRRVNRDPLYYPRNRFLANVTSAAVPTVTCTVDHGYLVGQEVRFRVESDFYSMIELNELTGTILTVPTANTFTMDIDTSAFTAFTFPTAAQGAAPFTPATVWPLGQDTAQSLISGVDILSDATDNRGILGVSLAAGLFSPAGQNNDVIYWIAGKSFSVTNA